MLSRFLNRSLTDRFFVKLTLSVVCFAALTVLSHQLVADETSSDGTSKSTEERPNILWLSTEDIGPHLGCYGDPDAVTPHLDDLAKKSVVYDIAWSNLSLIHI